MAKPVLLIRGTGNESDSAALSALGVPSLSDPYLEIAVSDEKNGALDLFNLLVESQGPLWVIATSTNAIKFWGQIVGTEKLVAALAAREHLHFAAIGQATSKALVDLGADQVLIPQSADSASLAGLLLEFPPGTALIPGGNLAMTYLPHELLTAGWTVRTAIVYTTSPVEDEPKSVPLVRNGEIAAVLLRSPSAARAFLTRIPHPGIPIVCAGLTTARTVAELGIKVDVVAEDPTPGTVAAAIVSLLTRQES